MCCLAGNLTCTTLHKLEGIASRWKLDMELWVDGRMIYHLRYVASKAKCCCDNSIDEIRVDLMYHMHVPFAELR